MIDPSVDEIDTAWMKVCRRLWIFGAVLCAAGCAMSGNADKETVQDVSFAAGKGEVPQAFTTALTGGGGPISWVVREDASAPGGREIVQTSTDDTSYRFPMCIYEPIVAKNVSAEVKFKALAGTVDQAAGLVLRYRPENYYVARANALEDNVNLFKTVNGNRLKIAEVEVKVTPKEWHTLGFSAKGKHLTVTFDGKTVIETDDTTFARSGKVGLWTKADSVSAFADLHIETNQ
jgi:hypothetical protein